MYRIKSQTDQTQDEKNRFDIQREGSILFQSLDFQFIIRVFPGIPVAIGGIVIYYLRFHS